MNDFFRSRLTQVINMNHELVRLADRVDWSHIDTQLQPFFANVGRPAIPSRLMVGLHLLKSMHCLSDEAVCELWIENPYYQYFCGEEFFQHRLPIQRSSMTHWRKRVGEDFFQKLLQESLRIAFEEKALKTQQLTRVVVDTTVQPKAVAYPTDVNLMSKAMNALVNLAKENNVELRQTYQRVVKRALIKSGRYRHAKQMRRAKREEKFIRIRLGRILRDIRRKIEGDTALRSKFSTLLRKAAIIYTQSRHSDEKLYSLHAPETECIGKGKAHKPYEFGCKVSVMTHVNPSPGGHFVLSIGALHHNPFDGHTLEPVLKSYTEQTGITPERIYVDKGYQGHRYEPRTRVFKSGQKRGVHGVIKRELRRRSVIEPIIGHLKSDHSLSRNYLKGILGDKINAILAGVGYNFRLLLRWLRFFWFQFWVVALFLSKRKGEHFDDLLALN